MTRTLRCAVLAVAAGSIVAVPAVPAMAGGGGCHLPAPTDGRGTAVEMATFCMLPSTLRVEPGTTVTWTNADPVAHNVVGTGWGYGEVAAGESVRHTFDQPGTYAYACTLHPAMVGAVVVGEAPVPIAAVTDDDGGTSAPLVIGLLGVALAVIAFAGGARMGRRPAA